jgi:hypothetical protein
MSLAQRLLPYRMDQAFSFLAGSVRLALLRKLSIMCRAKMVPFEQRCLSRGVAWLEVGEQGSCLQLVAGTLLET